MITFGAKYLSPASIYKLERNKIILPHDIALVEFSKDSAKDAFTLAVTANFLPKRTGYASSINNDFAETSVKRYVYTNWSRFLALTEKQDDYNFIRPKNIHGLAEISSRNFDDTIYLNYLQTIRNFFIERFSHVGTEFLNCIKKMYPEKAIELKATPPAIGFYKTNGFQIKDEKKLNGLTPMIYFPTKH